MVLWVWVNLETCQFYTRIRIIVLAPLNLINCTVHTDACVTISLLASGLVCLGFSALQTCVLQSRAFALRHWHFGSELGSCATETFGSLLVRAQVGYGIAGHWTWVLVVGTPGV